MNHTYTLKDAVIGMQVILECQRYTVKSATNGTVVLVDNAGIPRRVEEDTPIRMVNVSMNSAIRWMQRYYTMPFLHIGIAFSLNGVHGTVVSAEQYLFGRLNGERRTFPFHPCDNVVYYNEEGEIIADYSNHEYSDRTTTNEAHLC